MAESNKSEELSDKEIFMINSIKLWDKIHLQKYLYLVKAFFNDEISAFTFVEYFLQIRREDTYWLASAFREDVNALMDSVFLDIDEFNPDELYDPDDKFNINEKELRERLKNKFDLLNRLLM